MNTEQLMTILSRDPYVSPIFRGVHAIDQLPPLRDGAYVINTAPHYHPGLHWIALWVNRNELEYFDSYGGDPLPRLQQWGKVKSWISNPFPLQSPLSAVCGQYCIYFLIHRARGIDMTTLLMDFGTDMDKNDKHVFDFVEDRYDMDNLTVIDTERLISQLSQALVTDPSIRKIASGQ